MSTTRLVEYSAGPLRNARLRAVATTKTLLLQEDAGADVTLDHDFLVRLISIVYVACNSLRLLAYLPQIAAVARDRSDAAAICLTTWYFWAFSHGVTAVYCAEVARDPLLAGMMWGNCAGAAAVAALTTAKRRAARPLPAAGDR